MKFLGLVKTDFKKISLDFLKLFGDFANLLEEPLEDRLTVILIYVAYSYDFLLQIFEGNQNTNGVVKNTLGHPFTAKYVRIRPENWSGKIALRVELYGCTVE